jgi:L-asparaginase II
MKNNNAPLIIEVTRGNIVESCHSVNMVISDSSGKIVRSWGNIEGPVYLRSAIKPLQALPLVETGAADAFAVSEKELSLACASHNGEEKHVDAVLNWLERIGLSETDLQCGVHWPSHQKTSLALAAKGFKPTQAHNNCSGKHTGFLTTALHMKEPTKGYIELDHPVQQRIVRVLEDFTGIDLSNAPIARDGCSIPTLGIPLDKSALAIARFADPSSMHADRAAACKRIQNAIARQPDMMAGLDRLCTALNGAAKGRVIAKVGAEGVYLAALPEHGFGIALKTVDGTTRAAESALGAALQYLGVMDEELHKAISPYTETILKNRNDFEVGKIRAVL